MLFIDFFFKVSKINPSKYTIVFYIKLYRLQGHTTHTKTISIREKMLDFNELSVTAYVTCAVFFCVWFISFASIIASFYLLLKMRHRNNQIVILLTLNLSEIVFSITIPLRLIPYFIKEQCITCEYIGRVETWNGFCYYGSFFLITIDRFLCLFLNIKYNIIVTPYRLKIAASIMVIGCFVCSLPFYFIPWSQSQFVVNSVIYPTLDSLFVITATAVYVTILVKLHTNRISDTDQRRLRVFDWSVFRRRYRVPMLIILTFVFFIQIPDLYIILSVYLRTTENVSEEKNFITTLIIYSCWFIGFLCDSIIYIRLVSKRQRRTNTITFST